MTVLLVRHAEPAVSPAVDPSVWPLSEAGRNAATQLSQHLPRDGRWIASTERKAYETLLCAGRSSVAVTQDPRFEDAVREHSADAEYLVVGTHGMVLTAWLVHARQQLAPSEAGSFWERMTFPDIIQVAQDPGMEGASS